MYLYTFSCFYLGVAFTSDNRLLCPVIREMLRSEPTPSCVGTVVRGLSLPVVVVPRIARPGTARAPPPERRIYILNLVRVR
jgi:hypothetical protein